MAGILFTPSPPLAPSTYQLPGSSHAVGPWRVDNTSDLIDVLSITKPQDIILADGTYDNPSAIANLHGHSLYAEHFGKVTFTAGFSLDGAGIDGASFRGIRFNVTNPAKTTSSSIIYANGVSGASLTISDCWFDSQSNLNAGIYTLNPESLIIERVYIRNFLEWGIFADAQDRFRILNRNLLILDVDLANVDGIGLQIGNGAVIRRVKTRECTVVGLLTDENVLNSEFSDLDIDDSTTGIHIDHFTSNSIFKRLFIGSGVTIGIQSDPIDPDFGHLPAGNANIFRDSVIGSSHVGIYLNNGTISNKIQRVIFLNQDWAAIGDIAGSGNTYTENDYSGIESNAVPVSTSTLPSAFINVHDARVTGLGLGNRSQDVRITGPTPSSNDRDARLTGA